MLRFSLLVWLGGKREVGIPIFDHTIPQEERREIFLGVDRYNQRLLSDLYEKQDRREGLPEDADPRDYEIYAPVDIARFLDE